MVRFNHSIVNNHLIYLFVIFCFECNKADKDFPRIELHSGIIQGNVKWLENGEKYYNFQGIPYALPPIGVRRFKDPVPYTRWKGILNATQHGPDCVQLVLRQTNYFVTGQEDCLYLNVYAPKNPLMTKELLPCMVWIYGGSFREGSSRLYGPDHFLTKNVVIVTFNYRLGIFGFLSTEDDVATGNYGLKDVLLVLKWVKGNIIKFGGDPSKITVFGESAGAAIVGYLMISVQSKDLFQQAILQSGSPLCPWALHRNPKKVAFDLGLALGYSTSSTVKLVKFLRNIDLAKETTALLNVNFVNFAEIFNNGGPFGPVLEPAGPTAFLTKNSYEILKNGNFHHIPVIIGLNTQESKFFNSLFALIRPLLLIFDVSPSSLARPAMNINPQDKRIFGTNIREHYFKSKSFFNADTEEFADFFSDDQFVRPVIETVQLLSKRVPVYFYVYDYEGTLGKQFLKLFSVDDERIKGVAHATELLYMFQMKFKEIDRFRNAEEVLVSRRLVTLWTNFAKYSNPTPVQDKLFDDIMWPQASVKNTNYYYIGRNISTGVNFKERNMQFWETLYKNYSKGPIGTY